MIQVKPLSAELQKIALEKLNEEPSRIASELEAFKQWIEQQSYLNVRTDDQFLIQFLRFSKFDLAVARQRLENFLAFKTKFPARMSTESAKFQEIHNLGCLAMLPMPLNDCGPRITLFRYKYSPDEYPIEELIEMCNATFEMCILTDPYACINGLIFIFDMDNLTLGHVLHYTPLVMKQLVAFYEKSLPLSIHSVCFINVPLIAEQFFKIFFTYLSEDLGKRVFICGKNMAKLTEKISLKYLPEDYGGSNGCLAKVVKNHQQVWNENVEYFRQNAGYGLNEMLRPNGAIDFDGLFSMGTFDWIKSTVYNRAR